MPPCLHDQTMVDRKILTLASSKLNEILLFLKSAIPEREFECALKLKSNRKFESYDFQKKNLTSVFRPQILIFRPNFKMLKMMLKCTKSIQKYFFQTLETQ